MKEPAQESSAEVSTTDMEITAIGVRPMMKYVFSAKVMDTACNAFLDMASLMVIARCAQEIHTVIRGTHAIQSRIAWWQRQDNQNQLVPSA